MNAAFARFIVKLELSDLLVFAHKVWFTGEGFLKLVDFAFLLEHKAHTMAYVFF